MTDRNTFWAEASVATTAARDRAIAAAREQFTTECRVIDQQHAQAFDTFREALAKLPAGHPDRAAARQAMLDARWIPHPGYAAAKARRDQAIIVANAAADTAMRPFMHGEVAP